MSPSHFCGPDIQVALPEFQPNTSVLKIVEDALRRNGDDVAMIEEDTGERVRFSELLQKSSSIASGLQRAGVSPRDVIILCCDKSILSYSLLLGVVFTGATAVIIPPLYADTIDKLTLGQDVKAVFYDSKFSESVSQSVAGMTQHPSLLGQIDSRDPTIATLLKSTQQLKMFQVDDVKKHVPIVLFSSGTTGLPKGIKLSDLAIQISGLIFQYTSKYLVNPSPFYWISALSTFLKSIIKNCPLILTNTKDARHRLRLFEKYKVDSFFCNISSMIQYVKEPMFDNLDMSSLKRVVIGGETLLSSVARKLFSKVLQGKDFFVVYGSTEAGLISILEVQNEESLQTGACGKLCPGVEVKILDDCGDPVELRVVGRIWVKCPTITGYWCRDEFNHGFLDSEGFYDTGDAGCFDPDGNLYLRGRICDLINFRGIKISPVFLEDLLIDHPAVRSVAVIGTPHPTDGQHPTAFVVLQPEYHGIVTNHDIMVYVDDRVEDSMRLRGGVHFRDSLPRVPNGKLIRNITT